MVEDVIETSERDGERSSEDVIIIYPRIPNSGSGDSEEAHTRPKVKRKNERRDTSCSKIEDRNER